MSQFDLETDAALTQLQFEELSTTPGGEFAEIIGDLLKLIGTGRLCGLAGGASNLIPKIRRLAGASYASNLIYAIGAVRNDLKDLYEKHEGTRVIIESLPSNPKFAEAISSLALRAMHTSNRERLKRLARILVNGVKEGDLEAESLDDMMRAAVELRGFDISLLKDMYEMDKRTPKAGIWNERTNTNLFGIWQDYWSRFPVSYPSVERRSVVGAFGRLSALGLIFGAEATSMGISPVAMNYWITNEGKRFHERIQDLKAED